MDPEISVVIPVYKTERWLRACVDSVLAQTLRSLELILVDDGSPDGCGAICDEYAKKDPRVRVLHKENGGVCSALTAGIGLCAAPYIGFMDSDDWIDPTFYEDLLRAVKSTGADVAAAEYVTFLPGQDMADGPASPAVCTDPDSGKNMLYAYYSSVMTPPAVNMVSKCNKLYRRQPVLDNLSYLDIAVWHGEDALMNAAILADCAAVTLVQGGGKYHYRSWEGSACHREDFGRMTDSLAKNELAFLGTFSRIIRDKDLDPQFFKGYLGRAAYTAALDCFSRRDISYGEKRRYARQVLASVSPDAPVTYARLRGSIPVTVYCRLLRAHIFLPCILVCGLLRRPGSERRHEK